MSRVLFVDDEPAILNAVKRLFRRDNFEIEVASDGASGLAKFEAFRPSVVVSDHRMPGMSGVEFLSRVRAADPDVVRVMLTGCTDLPAAEAAINEGEVWRFLTKPWNDEDLRATIAGGLERYRLVSENRLLLDKLSSIGLLAGGVAHELNNPIGGILAYAQMLRMDRPELANDLDLVEQAALRAKKIVSELLDFARNSKSESRTSFSVEDAAEKAISLARFQVKHGLKIERDFQGSLPAVFGDRIRLEQVILNLLSNAIHAVGSKPSREGVVTVRTSGDAAAVKISVSDDGPGIPPDARARIFEPFFTTKEPGKGTGLGLSISLGIVRDHGGSIDVETSPDGTTFTITLPALVRAAA